MHLCTEISSFNVLSSPFPKLYSDNLIRKGWCRSIVASAEIGLSLSLLRLVGIAGFICTSTGHQNCAADQCRHNLIGAETYTQKHWPRSCHCRSVKPDIATVLNILDAGCIPVVQFWRRAAPWSSAGSILLTKTQPTSRSPTCGLMVGEQHSFCAASRENKFNEGSWFWIDGLCVPKQKPYRGKAIQLMRHTYQNAAGVIFLDEGRRKLSSKSSDMDIGWSVFASGWFGRLWTY